MKKLRWAMDGGFWELDESTPATVEGEGRAVGGAGEALPLGVTRGKRLSRPKQIDFFQRFMAAPFVPSFSPSSQGWALHRVLTLPLTNSWFATLLAQFKVGQFVSSLQHKRDNHSFFTRLRDKSLYALGLCSELMLSPHDALFFSYDAYGHCNPPRKKAIFHHQFPNHDFTFEAVSPALFVDKSGSYWDVPFSMAADLASLSSDSGLSYHFCMRHNSGSPLPFQASQTLPVPPALLPGTSVKAAASCKQNLEIWRSNAPKLKMVQPFDMFLSNPHVSATGIIGAALSVCHGESLAKSIVVTGNSQDNKGFCVHAPTLKSTLSADIFSSISFTAQHGNFQRRFLDLTRCHVHLDFPSGSNFFSGATLLAKDFFNSQQPTVEAVQAICPSATVSFQQQIAGPFSFRVDSEVGIDLKNKDRQIYVHDPVFAIEYALQVLCSAKAIAWYSPKQQEFMVELRFFET